MTTVLDASGGLDAVGAAAAGHFAGAACVTTRSPQVGTICIRDDVLAAGCFHGELASPSAPPKPALPPKA
eukprot:243532-Chlamydomonas_euryale.AAC.2